MAAAQGHLRRRLNWQYPAQQSGRALLNPAKFCATALLLRAAAPARLAVKRLLRNKVPAAELCRRLRRYLKFGSKHGRQK
jgi:hypothetical protein